MIELGDVQAGRGGFVIRGVGERAASGFSLSGAGDVNGDGLADLLVGSPEADPVGRIDAGLSFVVFGKPHGDAVELSDVQAGRGGFAICGGATGDHSGTSVSGLGDVNGDGLADVIVGAPYAGPGRCCPYGAGESYVVFGKPDGQEVDLAEVQVGRYGFAIRGRAPDNYTGSSVSDVGDVNGDGLADIIVGATDASLGDRVRPDESYVVFGKPGGELVDLTEVRAGGGGFAIRGGTLFNSSGSSVSGTGDVNGDGLADIIVGFRREVPSGRCRAGESYVVFGKPNGAVVELSEIEAGRGGFAIAGSAEGDFSGASVSGAGDVNGDGLADLLVGAPGASPSGRYRAGESYVVFGKPGGELVELSDVQSGQGGFAIRGSAAGDVSGASVSGAGEVNGDGLADLLVGAPGADPRARYRAGESYIIFGKREGAPVELSEVQARRGGFAMRGIEERDYSGLSVSGAGDVNGDGLSDLIVGGPNASPGGRRGAGESYVVFGKPDGAPMNLSDVQAARGGFEIRGSAEGDSSGWSVSGAGDVNGDGLADLLVGAPGAEPGGRVGAGETYVVFGKPGGVPVELWDIQAGRGGFAIRGNAEGDGSGMRVSGAGDVNGDRLADVIIGARYADPGGRNRGGESYVVFGKPDGAAVELSEIQAGRDGFAIRGSAQLDGSGASVSGAGDVNGDGLADLLVGAPMARPGDRLFAGESYVVFGKPGGEAVELAEVQAGRGGFVIRGSAELDFSGASVSGAGDVNSDGLADLLVGAPRASPGGRYRAGEVYVVFGKLCGEAVELREVQAGRGGFAIRGRAERDYSGAGVSWTGDVNGDGLADVLIGAGEADPDGRVLAGEAYVVFGKPSGDAVELGKVEAGLGGFVIRGSAERDYAGRSVSGASDVNGDGLADLLIGAPSASPGGLFLTGESHVVFGKRDGAPIELSEVQAGRGGFAIRGSAPGDRSGSSVTGAGDLNGDGLPDLAIASGLADTHYPSLSSAVYVVFGRTASLPPPRFLRGAVRGEASLNISDGIHLLRYLFLGDAEPRCLDAADADDSGRLDLTDAVRILRYLFLGAAAPPPPGPTTCGVDPTVDDLGCAAATRGCAP